ncbi:MAG TPA: BadF/BadG/BcrA/BcrD ATPase family protein [Thermomicrobiales bacterium]|nr:BadF/BadG/BcrA/BcrD ATPase family protein [Thermomicrobiales bacterium]
MSTFIGIDGGGTKTDLALIDDGGRLLARLQGDSSNQAAVGFDAAIGVLADLVDRARSEAGIDGPVTAGWIGMAGSDRAEDRIAFRTALGDRFRELRITNDAELVLSGTPNGSGVALIAGTGSIAFARNEQGITGRSGGWGHVFGDEGSAYTIAVEGLRAIAAETDGRGPASRLTRDLLRWWQAETPPELISRVYRPEVRKADIAASAPVVVAAAEAGDFVACSILDRSGDALASLVTSLLDRIPFAELPTVAGTGGLLLQTTIVRQRLSDRLDAGRVNPKIQLIDDIAASVAHALRRFHAEEEP